MEIFFNFAATFSDSQTKLSHTSIETKIFPKRVDSNKKVLLLSKRLNKFDAHSLVMHY